MKMRPSTKGVNEEDTVLMLRKKLKTTCIKELCLMWFNLNVYDAYVFEGKVFEFF